MNENLTGTATRGYSHPGSYGNEGFLHIPQIPRTEASLSDLVLCHIQDTRCWMSYSSAVVQSAYSDLAEIIKTSKIE